jgi:hypothetical protein
MATPTTLRRLQKAIDGIATVTSPGESPRRLIVDCPDPDRAIAEDQAANGGGTGLTAIYRVIVDPPVRDESRPELTSGSGGTAYRETPADRRERYERDLGKGLEPRLKPDEPEKGA